MTQGDPFARQHPAPPDLTPEEQAHRQARSRWFGLAILALCVLLAAGTLVVILSLNRGDEGGMGRAPGGSDRPDPAVRAP